jgi:hypothetical protein
VRSLVPLPSAPKGARFNDQPERSATSFKPGVFTETREITDSETEGFLRNYRQEFHDFIARVMRALQGGRALGLLNMRRAPQGAARPARGARPGSGVKSVELRLGYRLRVGVEADVAEQ